jgi:hypothetical protein
MYGPLEFELERANFTIGRLQCSGMSKHYTSKVGVLRDSHNLFFQHCMGFLNEIWREKKPICASRGSRCAPNFIQKSHTVLKNRLWESRSTPTLGPSSAWIDTYFDDKINVLQVSEWNLKCLVNH